jgi:hypothetical protein
MRAAPAASQRIWSARARFIAARKQRGHIV